jgi:hypothetical protein
MTRDREDCAEVRLPGVARAIGVGWPMSNVAWAVSSCDVAWTETLVELFSVQWSWAAIAGPVTCPACCLSRGPDWITLFGRRIDLRTRTLLVPGGDVVYFVPAMILHLIDSHSYAPPSQFARAVVECALPGTARYFQQLQRAGARHLVREALANRKGSRDGT